MFEEFIDNRIEQEKAKINTLGIKDIPSVKKTDLLPYVKKYLIKNLPVNFNQSDVNELLERSVKLNFNYTIRPVWTLLKFIFNNLDSQKINVVLGKLDMFLFYRYYGDIIARYIEEHANVFITKKQFEKLLEDANRLVYEKFSTNTNSEKIKNLFIQLFRLKHGSDNNITLDSTIPFSFLRIFLEDKGYHNMLSKFLALNKFTDTTEISQKDIIKILSSKDAYGIEESVSEDASEISIKPVNELQIINDAKLEAKEDTEKLIIDVAGTNGSTEVILKEEPVLPKNKAEEKKIIEDEPAIYSPELQEASDESSNYETLIENPHPVRSLFTREEVQKMADRIYKGDIQKTYRLLDSTGAMQSWDDAASSLKKVFLDNEVDIYDKYVVLMVDILNEHFRTKEKAGG